MMSMNFSDIVTLTLKVLIIALLLAELAKTIIKFGNIEIENQKFHQYKRSISVKNIDIKKIAVSNKVSFGKKGFKYFIGYKDAKIRPLKIFLPKISAYRRDPDETK